VRKPSNVWAVAPPECCSGPRPKRPGLRRALARCCARVGVLLAWAFSSWICACGGARGSGSPPAAYHAAASGSGATALAVAFPALRERILGELLADDPSTARDLGLHEYDGKVPSFSAEALAARRQRLDRAALDLAAVDERSLTDDERLDRAELQSWLATSRFWLVDMDAPHHRPQTYEDLFSVSVYIDRDYAPLEVRARALLAQEEAALEELPHIRENLTPPLSKSLADVASRNFAGFAVYLRGDVAHLMDRQGDDAQRRRFALANASLAKAADDLGAWLKAQSAHGDQSHVLGPERYAALLRAQEGITMPLEAFERLNEDNLLANEKAYETLAGRVHMRPVEEAALFTTARSMMNDARAFIVDHDIVTIPFRDEPVVRETPPYERWNSASIEMSGPFEAVRSAYYQLTIPDRSWPPAERQAYLGTLEALLGTTIHEVYSGHFVQGQWAERAPTRVQKAFGSYSFVEGWAHYGEQMMIDEGFGEDDPANRLAMLDGALLRNCRFAVSVGMHTKGMTLEQAERRFVHDCHQDGPTAHEQAVRGTFDPGYFAYTLGKLQILALREEAKAKLGPRFSLQRFHDALLSHGAPPIALIHDVVLRQMGAQ
jgi:uncharacterized protein (DUF885 family)